MNDTERILTGSIQGYIAIEPQSLADLVALTGEPLYVVYGICNRLVEKDIIHRNAQGKYYVSERLAHPPQPPQKKQFWRWISKRKGAYLKCPACGSLHPANHMINGACAECDRWGW